MLRAITWSLTRTRAHLPNMNTHNDMTAPKHSRALSHLDGARDLPTPRDRRTALLEGARALRSHLMAAEPVAYYRSMELVRAPYPVKYGLRDAASVPTPFMHIVNRMFVVQFSDFEGLPRTMVVSPTDMVSAGETPFFRRLRDRFAFLGDRVAEVLGPVHGTVQEHFATLGIDPATVDYVTFDHLHTQDVRPWVGSEGDPGYFPNAVLLAMRQEWVSTQGLLPPQTDWYRPQGTAGVDPSRVLLLDGDTELGPGVALIHTPGHTEGNHSVVVRTPEGLMVTSENGVGPDAYAPLHSRIPGVAAYARRTGMEVVLNGNTMERGLDQYLSMLVEREVAGPSARDPRFYNVVCSSEFDSYWLFPGIKPTFVFGDLHFGQPRTS